MKPEVIKQVCTCLNSYIFRGLVKKYTQLLQNLIALMSEHLENISMSMIRFLHKVDEETVK